MPLVEQPTFEELWIILNRFKQDAVRQMAGDEVELLDARKIIPYLTRLLASDLEWFYGTCPDEISDDRVEIIKESASKRIAERCGRTGELPYSQNCQL